MPQPHFIVEVRLANHDCIIRGLKWIIIINMIIEKNTMKMINFMLANDWGNFSTELDESHP